MATTAAAQPAATPTPLTDADLDHLRERLQAGERPKVQLLQGSALGPAGTPGVVRHLDEPATGECVLVRVRGDDLPFAPSELSWPVRRPRGRPRKNAQPVPPAAAAAKAPLAASPIQPAPTPQPPQAAAAERKPAVAEPAPATRSEPESPAPARPASRRRGTAGRAGGKVGGKVGSVSLALRFTGTGWTVESTRSGKRSKPQPVSLAAMRALATRLDDVELRNAILASLDACRQQVQERASALRAELERAEIALAELDEDA